MFATIEQTCEAQVAQQAWYALQVVARHERKVTTLLEHSFIG